MAIPKKMVPLIAIPSVEDLVRELVDDPDQWLDTNNDQLGGEKPRALVGTPKEAVLRNLLEAIRNGSFS
ncbi:MAG: hypothetical protein ACRELF_10570 [Gemmataceae bacterium]